MLPPEALRSALVCLRRTPVQALFRRRTPSVEKGNRNPNSNASSTMPHTPRRKETPNPLRKRQLLDVGDGWTTIVSSPSVAKAPTPSSPSLPATFEPATIPPGLTIEKLCDEYIRYKETWEESACCREVVAVLKKKLSGRHDSVNGCVCLGLGSLTDGRSRRVGMLQLAVLETVVGILGRPYDHPPVVSILRFVYFLQACEK